jgi:hypothetical protein
MTRHDLDRRSNGDFGELVVLVIKHRPPGVNCFDFQSSLRFQVDSLFLISVMRWNMAEFLEKCAEKKARDSPVVDALLRSGGL